MGLNFIPEILVQTKPVGHHIYPTWAWFLTFLPQKLFTTASVHVKDKSYIPPPYSPLI